MCVDHLVLRLEYKVAVCKALPEESQHVTIVSCCIRQLSCVYNTFVPSSYVQGQSLVPTYASLILGSPGKLLLTSSA